MTKELLGKIKELEKAVGNGWLEEIQKVDTASGIVEFAKKHGVTVDMTVAEEAFELLNETELSDKQLNAISGGITFTEPELPPLGK